MKLKNIIQISLMRNTNLPIGGARKIVYNMRDKVLIIICHHDMELWVVM